MKNIIDALICKYKEMLLDSTKRVEEMCKEYKAKDTIDTFVLIEQIGMINYFIHDLQSLQQVDKILATIDKE